jgi:hypothetical protein
VQRYITPAEFDEYAILAKDLGFKQVASGPNCGLKIITSLALRFPDFQRLQIDY